MRRLRTRNKTKGLNPGAMLENPKQKEGIESKCDAKEPVSKGQDLIWAQCTRTRIKIKGSNLGAIPENLKEREGIESERDEENPKYKEGIESRCNAIELKSE